MTLVCILNIFGYFSIYMYLYVTVVILCINCLVHLRDFFFIIIILLLTVKSPNKDLLTISNDRNLEIQFSLIKNI